MKFLTRHVLTLRTPIGRKMARLVRLGGGPLLRHRREDLLRAGVIWHEARTVGVRDGRPVLADGQVLDVASIVWCTGFRPAYEWIGLPVLDGDGWPVIAARGGGRCTGAVVPRRSLPVGLHLDAGAGCRP